MHLRRLRALALLSLALAGPATAVESIREENGRDWALTCTENGGKPTRICSVHTALSFQDGPPLECGFSVIVVPTRSFVRLSCDRDIAEITVTVEDTGSLAMRPAEGPGPVVDGGNARFMDALISALKFERRHVAVSILPFRGEPITLTLGSKDFDKMYGQALVVSDQVL